MQTEPIAVGYPLVTLPFVETDFGATQTDTAIPVAGSTVTGYAALLDGWVVGFAAKLSAAAAAGALSLDVAIAGVQQGIDSSIATAETTEYTQRFNVGDYPFSAGDVLGMSYTSDGSLDPETIDAQITLYIMYREANFR